MGRWDRTHAALQQAALELFATQGYSATGTAQIAAHAGVSEMTLFRHFPAKEALLLDDPFDPLIADAVRSRPGDETAMCALTEGIRQAWGDVDTDGVHALRTRLRIMAESASLRGAIERNSEATVTALTGALTDRGLDNTSARVAATAAVAGLGVALLEWARSEELSLRQALERALDVLGGA